MKYLFLSLVICIILIISVRPSPRGWTEQSTSIPTPTVYSD